MAMALTPYGTNIETADVVLLVGKERFYVHKEHLANKSPYFQAMFNSNMKESTADIIEIKDITASSFEKLIGYCYGKSYRPTEENVYDILYASSMLSFVKIQKDCINFLASRLDMTNCLEAMLLADSLSIPCLHLSAKQVACWHFSVVCKGKEILTLPLHALTRYLSLDDLRIASEMDIFETVMRWIKHDKPVRTINFEQLLSVVRFSQIGVKEMERILNTNVLNEFGNCERIKTILREILATKLTAISEAIGDNDSGSSLETETDSDKSEHQADDSEHIVPAEVDEATVSVDVDCNMNSEINAVLDVNQSLPHCNPEVDNSFVNNLLTTPPRKINFVPAMVANFSNSEGLSSPPPTLAYYDQKKAQLVNHDYVIKAFQNSRIALGFRACIIDKYVYITGGEFSFGDNSWNHSIWKYDIFSRRWSFVINLRNQRRHHLLCVVDEFIYIIGGHGRFRATLNTAEKLDTITETWSDIASLPVSIYTGVCTSFRNKIYVLQTNVYCYDTAADAWSCVRNIRLPHEHDFHSVVTHSNKMYLMGRQSKHLYEVWHEANADEDMRYRSMGEFENYSSCACLIGDDIYVFNVEESLVETYNIRTGAFGVHDTKNWSEKWKGASMCYGCFPLPKFDI